MTEHADRVIFDLDGTIALDHHRSHHIAGERKDWNAYFAACTGDEPHWPVIRTLRAYYDLGLTINILTGRSETVRRQTVDWLRTHRVPCHFLAMRGEHDRTPDDVLKPRWADELGHTPENTLAVYEDRARVVAAWRARGYACFQVAEGAF